jgi:hypothetical protein
MVSPANPGASDGPCVISSPSLPQEAPVWQNRARFNDGRFRVTTAAQLRVRARFVFTGHWPLEAWGGGTTAGNRRGPPSLPRAEPGLHGLNSWTVKC